MKYIFEMPPDKIMFLAMILESYEDVAVVTTLEAGEKTESAKRGGRYKSVVIANVADNFDALFHKIIASLDDGGLKIKPIEMKKD